VTAGTRIVSSPVRVAWLAALLGLFAVGSYYRLRGVTGLQLLGDEFHALENAPERPYAGLFTHYARADNSVPLTLYARALIDTVGVTELRMRLPSLLPGLLLLLTPLLFLRVLRRSGVLLASALFASSSSLAYFSIVARPYAMAAFLALLAIAAWDRWTRSRSWKWMASFCVLGALASFFHLFSASVVGGLLLGSLCSSAGFLVRERALRWRDCLAAAIATLLLHLALFGPGLASLLEAHHAKIGEGRPDFVFLAQVGHALAGYLGGASGLLGLAIAYGLVRAWRDERLLALAGLAMFTLHAVLLAVTRPVLEDLAWARYTLPLWPFALVFAAWGVPSLLELLREHLRNPRTRAWLVGALLLYVLASLGSLPFSGLLAWLLAPLASWALALLLVLVALEPLWSRGAPGEARREACPGVAVAAFAVLFAAGVFAFSPVRFFRRAPDDFRSTRTAQYPESNAPDWIPPVYAQLGQLPRGECLLECPYPWWITDWAPYSDYQRAHGQEVKIASPTIAPSHASLGQLENLINPGAEESLQRSGARYLVLHTDLASEMDARLLDEENRNLYRNEVDWIRTAFAERHGHAIYADGLIEVYDVRGKPPPVSARPSARIR
jgi:hypothetical protein